MIRTSRNRFGWTRWLAAAVAFGVMGCGGAAKFDTAAVDTQEEISAQAGNFWKKQGWWSVPKDVRKVALTEFSVEFVTATGTQHQGLGLIQMAQWAGVGKKKMEFDEQMKRDLPGLLLTQYVAALQSQGFEVITPEAIAQTEGFAALKGVADGKKTGRSDRGGVSVAYTSYQKGQIYSAPPLLAVDSGFFASFSNPRNEGRALGEAGAEMGLRVRIRVGVDGKGRATLYEGSTITALKVSSWDTPQKTTDYLASPLGTLTSARDLYFSEPVISDKQFEAFSGDVYTVDGQAMSAAVRGVFPQFAELSAARLAKR